MDYERAMFGMKISDAAWLRVKAGLGFVWRVWGPPAGVFFGFDGGFSMVCLVVFQSFYWFFNGFFNGFFHVFFVFIQNFSVFLDVFSGFYDVSLVFDMVHPQKCDGFV